MLFLQNKYTAWYQSIVDRAKTRTIDGYSEKHHIIPKTLGGTNKKENLVLLTAREHFICHLLLTKMTEGPQRNKMIYALHMLSNASNKLHKRYVPSSKLYEYERKLFSETHSNRMKENHPLKNPVHKLSHQIAIAKRGSTSVKGVKRSESMKEKMRNRVWSEKAVENRLNNCLKAAEARKGSTWAEEKRQQMFTVYIEKNKHLFPQVFELYDAGANIRQISFALKISWDRVKYILDNRETLNKSI
jgi:hypothetical protein